MWCHCSIASSFPFHLCVLMVLGGGVACKYGTTILNLTKETPKLHQHHPL
jgi:hypothetical protein